MRTSVVQSSGAKSSPHVVVIGNQKGGSGKSTFALHIIVALLKAGKRVASFDLDLNQLTLTRYLRNRHEWDRKHEQKLELPDHYPVAEEHNDVHGKRGFAAAALLVSYDDDVRRRLRARGWNDRCAHYPVLPSYGTRTNDDFQNVGEHLYRTKIVTAHSHVAELTT